MLFTEQESTFSTLKQSDMCLVCIAFASWVLTSSDPKAADAWKAGMRLLELNFLELIFNCYSDHLIKNFKKKSKIKH